MGDHDMEEDAYLYQKPTMPRHQRINRTVIWCLVPLLVLLVLAYVYHLIAYDNVIDFSSFWK